MTRTWLYCCVALLVSGCATPGGEPQPVLPDLSSRLNTLLPTDALLLGEQHDAAQHQRIHRDVVATLAQRGALAAVVLEMAEQGHSTRSLPSFAPAYVVRNTLQWNDRQWPWAQYGAAVMAAVRHGVPVIGSNLPRAQMRSAMQTNGADTVLDAAAFQAQQAQIRSGHCNMLPESQIVPMTRVQIARDMAMAQAVTGALQPGKTVVLLAGAGHIDRQLGVPRHLASGIAVKSLQLRAQNPTGQPDVAPHFDAVWPTEPVEAKDYCAAFEIQKTRPQTSP